MQEMNWTPESGTVHGTGQHQEATPHRQRVAQTELDGLADYHAKAATHLWLVIVSHRATDQMLNAIDGGAAQEDGPAILDVDSMVGMPAVACYICEVAYQPRLRLRKCPGGVL